MHTYALTNADKIKNSSAKELLQMRYIKVLRGKFSAVDLREEPCNNGLPEKEKLTRENEKDNIKNCTVRRRNRANLQAG